MVLLITYDLHNPGRDYEDVIKSIKTARSWAHPQGSVWLIDTDSPPASWVQKIKNAGDANDEYLIVQLEHNCAWQNMSTNVIAWLKSPTRTW